MIITIKCSDFYEGPSGDYIFVFSNSRKRTKFNFFENFTESEIRVRIIENNGIYKIAGISGQLYSSSSKKGRKATFLFSYNSDENLEPGILYEDLELKKNATNTSMDTLEKIKAFFLIERLGLYCYNPSFLINTLYDLKDFFRGFPSIFKLLSLVTTPSNLNFYSFFRIFKVSNYNYIPQKSYYDILFYISDYFKDLYIKLEAENMFYIVLDFSSQNLEVIFAKNFFLSKNFKIFFEKGLKNQK